MKKIVLLYRDLIPSVRLCGYEQFTWLDQCGVIRFDALPLNQIRADVLRNADAVVFVRGDSYLERCLAQKLKKAGKYLIYALDDDLLNIPDFLSSAAFYHRTHVKENISALMAACDCLITPSQRLGEKYGAAFQSVILMEEPALDCVKRTPKEGPVKIGFAGSIDRTSDFDQILAQPLRQVKETLGDRVSIEFFGAKPAVAEELGCKWYPYTNSYSDYQRMMRQLDWDIGLAPMPDTEFHSCKHYNKFIEYGGFGIISVCSRQLPYTRIVKDRENGILCPNSAQAWTQALLELAESESLRRQLSEQLYRQIRDQFQVPQVAEALWQQLDDHIPELKNYTLDSLAEIQIKMLFVRAKEAVCTHTWRLPIVAVKKVVKRLKPG